MSNEELINKFYQSFSAHNSDGMIECYHKDIVFEDPAFGRLEGDRAKAMWEMLLSRSGGDLKVSFKDVKVDGDAGSAFWVAKYNYGPKKRAVVNEINANFEFKDGKIIKHTDHFDSWKWSTMALGLPGKLLGWSSFMKNKIKAQTNSLLNKYIASQGK